MQDVLHHIQRMCSRFQALEFISVSVPIYGFNFIVENISQAELLNPDRIGS